MKLVTTTTMREIERRTIEEFGVKGAHLMDRAGYCVAAVVRRLAEISGFNSAYVHLVAGRGNNGGDAFVAARYLKEQGFGVEVWLAGSANQLSGDAALHFGKLKAAKIRVEELPTPEDWEAAMANPFVAEIVVDGVLGTGLTGPARGPAAGAIRYIRSQANEALVVSIDVPSGLNADTGETEGDTVMADLTVTMGLPKIGLVDPRAIDYVGTLEVADIGLPREVVADAEADAREMIFSADLKPLFPRRKRNAHKGLYGHALVIAGARGFSGAAALSIRAAIRAGAGLVSAVVPEGIQPVVAGAALEAMIHAAPQSTAGSLSLEALPVIRSFWNRVQAVLIGPGLTRGSELHELVLALLAEAPVPVVLDADALAVLGSDIDALATMKHGLVLTPHPGEMAGLLGLTAEAVQADRLTAAAHCARRSRAVVVLKGAGTVVAAPQQTTLINLTGNPGMATGGTGDVLAGLLVGLLAQGFSPYDAARAAVFVHGRAGDLASWRRCQVSLSAGDLLDELPFAFRDLTLR
jgi:NAD(P)H-hydrate epimerase